MAATKKKRRPEKGPAGAGDRLRDAWKGAVTAFGKAEAEVERQVRRLLKRNRITAQDAAGVLRQLRARLARERKRVVKDLQGRLQSLQNRFGRERKALGKVVEGAVHGALSAFNIPSRREISELTRKVDALTKKIDGLKA